MGVAGTRMSTAQPSSVSGAGTAVCAVVGVGNTKTSYISLCPIRQRKTTLDLKQAMYSKAFVRHVMEEAEKPNGMVRQS